MKRLSLLGALALIVTQAQASPQDLQCEYRQYPQYRLSSCVPAINHEPTGDRYTS